MHLVQKLFLARFLAVFFIRCWRLFDDEVSFNHLPESENTDQGISLQVDWDMGGGTLTSITALRKFDSDDLVDADFSNVDIASRDEHAEQDSFSQELRFNKSFDNGNFIVGAYYFQQDLDSESNTVMGADFNNFVALSVFSEAATLAGLGLLAEAQITGEIGSAMVLGIENVPLSLGNPLIPLRDFLGFTGIGFPQGGNGRNIMEQEHQAWAIFGQLDYQLTEELEITVGARYTDESKEIDGTFSEPGASWGLLLGLEDLTIFNPRPNVSEDLDDEQITANLKLTWKPSEDKMFYASYATGYKSGGTNTDRINPAFSQLFDAENSATFELGMKADFPDQNLRANFTIHRTKTEDYQTNAFQGAGFNLSNAGEVITKGAELEFWWNPADNLEIAGAYIYNEGEFKGFDRANCYIGYSWLTGMQDPGRANPLDEFCDRSGDPIDSNAENTIMLSATQSFAISDGVDGYLHANWSYRDEQYKDGNIDPLKVEDGYDILNMQLGVNFNELDLEVTLWARNLLDEDYLATYFDVPLQSGKINAYPTEPRTYGLSLTKTF